MSDTLTSHRSDLFMFTHIKIEETLRSEQFASDLLLDSLTDNSLLCGWQVYTLQLTIEQNQMTLPV